MAKLDVVHLVELVTKRAREEGDKPAFTFLKDGEIATGSLSFIELERRARTIGAALSQHCQPGDRALLLYPSGLDYIAAFFGCLFAGVIAVPSYPPRKNRADSRLQSIYADAKPAVVMACEEIYSFAHQQDFLAECDNWLVTDDLDESVAKDWVGPEITGETLAFLQYTSGSTGDPKGVMVSHHNLVHNAHMIMTHFGHGKHTTFVTWPPLFHDMGLIGCIIHPLYVGIHVVLMAPVAFLQKPYRWLKAISDFKATTSGGPNFAYELCLQKVTDEQLADLDLSSWEVAFNGAEPIRRETLTNFTERFAKCGARPNLFLTCYGMAETTLLVSSGNQADMTPVFMAEPEALQAGRAVQTDADNGFPIVGCGQPWFDGEVDIQIVDPQDFSVCEDGHIGEVWVGGEDVAQGYWQNKEATEQTFRAYTKGGQGPYLRTGDLGFMHQGELYFSGRHKDLIIIRGQNHYPQDIELTAGKAHAALNTGLGAAFSVERDKQERLIVVYEVHRTAMRKLDIDEVARTVRSAISERHDLMLDALVLIKPGTLTKTSSGKIQRSGCKQVYLNDGLNVVADWHLPVATAADEAGQGVEDWLIARLSEALGIPVAAVNADAPFSEYGLDSASAVMISGELGNWLKRDIPPGIMYDYSCIRTLAAHLEGRAGHVNAVTGSQYQQPIAVIGLDCHFAATEGPKAFWTLLKNHTDAIGKTPAARYNLMVDDAHCLAWGGFVEEVDHFDAGYFGIAPKEAKHMDPQQRLLLEVCWQALHHAGIDPVNLSGSQTGVFVGITSNDYMRLPGNTSPKGAYTGTGNAMSIAANRLSYQLDLRGPSKAVDTACSSSLVAVHDACRALLGNECDMAIAGGVNLRLAADLTNTFEQAKMLSPDGRCKTFDAGANGYVRSEGCGLVILKRLDDAKRDSDQIFAAVAGSAINQDGRSNGITAPNGPAQQAVIRQALSNANLKAEQIQFVECHGTGTPLGDPIEVSALQAVFDSEGSEPCYLGATKTNIGHLEAAAGIVGFIKTVLAMEHGLIPANLHHRQLNPAIDFSQSRLMLVNHNTPWVAEQKYAGISSFGFGGTNAHVILQSVPDAPEGRPSLPPVHFERLSYWFDRVDDDRHPLLGSGQSHAFLAEKDKLFESRLGQSSPGFLQDHVIYQLPLLPATGFVEMALSACRMAKLNLHELRIVKPLALSDTPQRVQTWLRDGQQLMIVSETEEGWQTHAEGRLAEGLAPITIDAGLSEFQAACSKVVSVQSHYQRLSRQGLFYGEQFRAIEQLHVNDDTVLAKLKLRDSRAYQLHPVVLDAALQSLAALIDWHTVTRSHAVVPTGFEELAVLQPGKPVAWAAGRLTSADHELGHFTARLYCFNDSGELVAQIGNIQLQAVSREELTGKEDDEWLYHFEWQPVELTELPSAKRPLVFMHNGGFPDCVRVTPGDEPIKHSDGHFSIRQQNAEDLSWLLGQVDRDQIIYAWSLRADCPQAAEQDCQNVRLLVQAIERPVPLTLITNTSAQVANLDRHFRPVANAFGAVMNGLAKVIAIEHPELSCRVVDLDIPFIDPGAGYLSPTEQEPYLAVYNQGCFVPRLMPAQSWYKPDELTRDFVARPAHCYIITGGSGALGQVMLDWLVSRGARKVVLLSRKAFTPPQIDGVDISAIQADVSNLAELKTAFEALPAPPAGVIHAAGYLEDGLIGTMSEQQMQRVLAAKVSGSWNLHQLTKNDSLDMFIMFSSVAGVMGSVAQANYAAANSFIDALAAQRRGLGLVAQSINWGPWAEQGMATSEAAKQAYSQLGIEALSNAQGLNAFEQIVRKPDWQQTLVMPVDWQTFARHRKDRLLSDIITAEDVAQDPDFVATWQTLAGKAEQEGYVKEQLTALIYKVLEVPDGQTLKLDKGFFELGVDSLMAVEIKNQIQGWVGHSLSSTLLFKYPYIEALVAYVVEQLNQSAQPAAVPVKPKPISKPVDKSAEQADVTEMSEQELEALINAKFEQYL